MLQIAHAQSLGSHRLTLLSVFKFIIPSSLNHRLLFSSARGNQGLLSQKFYKNTLQRVLYFSSCYRMLPVILDSPPWNSWRGVSPDYAARSSFFMRVRTNHSMSSLWPSQRLASGQFFACFGRGNAAGLTVSSTFLTISSHFLNSHLKSSKSAL